MMMKAITSPFRFRKVHSIAKILKVQLSSIGTVSKIPPPTWSLKDLSLTKSDTSTSNNSNNKHGEEKIISDGELQTLSERCLIDISTMGEDEHNNLKVELGNIMRCISLVTSFDPPNIHKLENQEEKEEMMYDVPRGFSSSRSCPLRNDDGNGANAWRDEGVMEEATYILDHLKEEGKMVQSKLVEKPGDSEHSSNQYYFAVTTEKNDSE
jgi:hypothetical protein